MIIKPKLQFFSAIIAFSLFIGLLIGVVSQAQWLNNLNLAGQQLIQHRSIFADAFFTTITHLGSVIVTSTLTLLLSLVFIVRRQFRLLRFLLVNVVLFAGVITQLVKYLVRNPRPMPQLISENGYSFPSGHTMIAILLYGTLIIIIQAHLQKQLLKQLATSICFALIIIIPISRIYVNVHYPSDILAGLTLGYSLLIMSQNIFHIGGQHA
ncbi:phosphatase PAP2 family protein [Leuconostoc sp. MS02]|uniref:Phosphatase PAP2 family protein n=1 Tax=Leuconostoc aquikimchii TaxID=3236804 RepID=A0ABV3S221_9LACO